MKLDFRSCQLICYTFLCMENGDKQAPKGSAFARGGTDEEKVTRFVAGGVVSIAALLAGGIFTILWVVTTTRILGPKDYGIYGPIVGLFWSACAFFSLGVPQTITTFVSHHFEKDPEMSRRFASDGVKMLMLLGLALIVLVGLGGGLLFLLGRVSGFFYAIGVILAAGIFVTFLFWGINSILNGYQRLDYVAIGNMVAPVGMSLGALAFMVAAQALFGRESRLDVVGATMGFFVGHLLGFAAASHMLRRVGAISLKEIFGFGNYHGLFKEILKFGGVSAVALVAMNVLINYNTPLVGLVIKDEEQVGYFGAAILYASVMMLIMGFSFALIPAISEAEGQGRKDLMQKYYNLALKYSFGLLLSLFTFYAVMAGRAVWLISGPEFPPPVLGPMVVALSLGTICMSMIFLMTFVFIGLKRPAIPAVVNVAVLVLQAAGIVLFCAASRNVMSAAWGILAASGLGVVALFYLAWRRFGLAFPSWAVAIPGAASLPTWAIGHYLLPKEGPLMGVTIALCFIMHGVFFMLFGGYDSEDFAMFRETVGSMRMGFVKSVINGMEKLARFSPAFEWYKR
ncbi:MAG: oligosaccharide flippase family protein [bacterium]